MQASLTPLALAVCKYAAFGHLVLSAEELHNCIICPTTPVPRVAQLPSLYRKFLIAPCYREFSDHATTITANHGSNMILGCVPPPSIINLLKGIIHILSISQKILIKKASLQKELKNIKKLQMYQPVFLNKWLKFVEHENTVLNCFLIIHLYTFTYKVRHIRQH